MKLNSEFRHVMDPHRSHVMWGIFYVFLSVGLVGLLYFLANHISTHTVPVGKVLISTPYSKYVVGEPINFTLTNGFNAPIYISNQCPTEPLAIYRQTNNAWVRMHAQASSATCANEQRQVAVAANSSVTSSLTPWLSIFSEPGTYRLVAIVNSASALPYVDIQVVAPPQPNIIKTLAPPTVVHSTTPSTSKSTSSSTNKTVATTQTTSPVTPTTPTTPPPTPQTYVLHVNSSGVYDITSLTLNGGDSLQIIYSPPYHDEVRTRFSPVSPTTATLSSMTVDSETTTLTRTLTTTGTWTFKASDHNGNTGTITVK